MHCCSCCACYRMKVPISGVSTTPMKMIGAVRHRVIVHCHMRAHFATGEGDTGVLHRLARPILVLGSRKFMFRDWGGRLSESLSVRGGGSITNTSLRTVPEKHKIYTRIPRSEAIALIPVVRVNTGLTASVVRLRICRMSS